MEKRQSNRDRISSLPNELIHNILSHLDTREVVHTSILSNRWRYIWLSIPVLDFDLDYWEKITRDRNRSNINARKNIMDFVTKAFMDFVENVLMRRGSNNIFKFRLYTFITHFDFDLPRVSSWIKTCLARNVQHLILHFPIGLGSVKPKKVVLNSFLPRKLFSSNLRKLDISFVPNPLVQLPNIRNGLMIRNLHLHGVRLPKGNANDELNLSSNVLEEMKIDLCDVNHLKVINVSAHVLQKLWLRLRIDRKEDRLILDKEKQRCDKRVKVNVITPNIKSLGLGTCFSKYSFPVDYFIDGELLSLVTADIQVLTNKLVDEECFQQFVDIMHKVYRARALQLIICSKQVLNDFPILLEEFPHRFQNMRYNKLEDQMEFPCLHAMANFLSSFPHIETLVWERTWGEWHGVSTEAGELVANEIESLNAGLFQNMFSCLMTAEFQNLEGSELEFQFIAFVLERAVCLKKLTIQFRGYRALTAAKLTELKFKYLSLPRASPNTSICFQ